jgi:hypothetical protein
MSGNGSYIKSMNGIVSFDSGGTTIEGGDITSDIINCDTLNATTELNTNTINSSTIYADFILNSANPNISIIGDTVADVLNLYRGRFRKGGFLVSVQKSK